MKQSGCASRERESDETFGSSLLQLTLALFYSLIRDIGKTIQPIAEAANCQVVRT
jgi:hypothetical protein